MAFMFAPQEWLQLEAQLDVSIPERCERVSLSISVLVELQLKT